jgi:hypothetical protein
MVSTYNLARRKGVDMVSLLILGAIVLGLALVVLAVIVGRRKRDKTLERIARIEEAMMKTRDDPI